MTRKELEAAQTYRKPGQGADLLNLNLPLQAEATTTRKLVRGAPAQTLTSELREQADQITAFIPLYPLHRTKRNPTVREQSHIGYCA